MADAAVNEGVVETVKTEKTTTVEPGTLTFFQPHQPLGLPEGSVSAIITILFVLGTLYLFMFQGAAAVPGDLLAITSAAVFNYIGNRQGVKAGK